MNRRSLLKMLSALPFLGFVAPCELKSEVVPGSMWVVMSAMIPMADMPIGFIARLYEVNGCVNAKPIHFFAAHTLKLVGASGERDGDVFRLELRFVPVDPARDRPSTAVDFSPLVLE
jgi:hypothetical protein